MRLDCIRYQSKQYLQMGVFMEFKNLDRNVLYCLDEKRRQAGFPKAVRPEVIYKAFADIPAKNITETLWSLDGRGLLTLDPDARRLSLTAAGKDAVKKMRRRLERLQG